MKRFGQIFKSAGSLLYVKIFIFVKISIHYMENTQTKTQYLSPVCWVIELAQEGIMQQTSYHYEPGWDD